MSHRRFTRRIFLKAAAVCSTALAVPLTDSLGVLRQRMIAVPPSIMLHGRQAHLDNLGTLIDWLLEQGLTPITYRALWDGLTVNGPLPANPVIVSIDDLTLVKGSSNFTFIEKMVNVLIEKKAPGVLALNTEPAVADAAGQLVSLQDQDDSLWAVAKSWLQHGIELATHTHSHVNLANPTLRAEDYQREIGGSAQMIAERTGQAVTTLVLPYGNGLISGEDAVLMPPIVEACRAAGIGIAVGVAGGRIPLVPATVNAAPVYFVGRVGPLRDNFGSIYGDINYWRSENGAHRFSSDMP